MTTDWKSAQRLVVLLNLATMLWIPGCYLDWDEIEYQEICSPLDPETECGRNQRCQPRVSKDPMCEGPVSVDDNQDGFCRDNDDCGTFETCMAIDDVFLPSKICMQFCLENKDCPEDYTCSKSGAHHMEIRGEEWGVCFSVTPPPPGWQCDAKYYAGKAGGGDFACDCECGVFDPDCQDASKESCEMCYEGGIRRHCVPLDGWDCEDTQYADGNCDCGCGVLDNWDCDDPKQESCDECPAGSCGFGADCEDLILPDNNAACKEGYEDWLCGLESYHDGTYCDCGCGVTDPDCDGPENTYCDDRCLEGSCAQDEPACTQNLFMASDNALCVQ